MVRRFGIDGGGDWDWERDRERRKGLLSKGGGED